MSNSITPQKTNCNKKIFKSLLIRLWPVCYGQYHFVNRIGGKILSFQKIFKKQWQDKKNQLRFYPKLILRIISETIIHLPDKIRLKFQKRLATLPKRLPVHERESWRTEEKGKTEKAKKERKNGRRVTKKSEKKGIEKGNRKRLRGKVEGRKKKGKRKKQRKKGKTEGE